MRFFFREDELNLQLKEYGLLLRKDPEGFRQKFDNSVLTMQGMGCLALVGGIILLGGILSELMRGITN